MKVVFGIGNPGREYASTRHNVGFRVADRVAASLGVELLRRRFKGVLGEGSSAGERVLIVKPETFVNAAGECARAVLDYHAAGPGSLLVVVDDVNLALGRLRCRPRGSSGGHGGLESIVQHLGSEEFPRLRVGIARPGGGPLVEYVLGGFEAEELPLAEAAEARAAEAVLEWVRAGVESCMNRFNGPSEGEKEHP